MNFNEVMALVMPSIIALLFYSKVIKRRMQLLEALCYSTLFILITNCVSYAILIYLRKTLVFEFSPVFTMKYSIMATCIATIFVFVFRFVELNVNLNVKVESEDEKE